MAMRDRERAKLKGRCKGRQEAGGAGGGGGQLQPDIRVDTISKKGPDQSACVCVRAKDVGEGEN